MNCNWPIADRLLPKFIQITLIKLHLLTVVFFSELRVAWDRRPFYNIGLTLKLLKHVQFDSYLLPKSMARSLSFSSLIHIIVFFQYTHQAQPPPPPISGLTVHALFGGKLFLPLNLVKHLFEYSLHQII